MAIASKSGTGAAATAAAMRGPGTVARVLVAALVLSAGAHTAAAADAVFTVGNYPVEARADNAVTAKTKALADGQQAAFRSLLKRLVPVTAMARSPPDWMLPMAGGSTPNDTGTCPPIRSLISGAVPR